MGGFVLTQDGTPIQAMSFSKSWLEKSELISEYMSKHEGRRDPSDGINEFILAGDIDTPKITQAEIEDRSKGDIISKSVSILQTTWFISQCIVRWSTKIPVTELEIVTLGFALLNGITYALWWYKPQNVGIPVYLKAKSPRPLTNPLDTNEPPKSSNLKAGLDIELPKMGSETASHNQFRITTGSEQLNPQGLDDAKLHRPSQFSHKLEDAWDSDTCIESIFLIPYQLILGFLRPLSKLSEASCNYVCKGDLRVPMFFAEPVGDTNNIDVFTAIVATLFGCVHLVPSFFIPYASPTEMWLWRISAAFITIQPLISVIWASDVMDTCLPNWFSDIIGFLLAILLPLYVVARLALIFLSFLSLRNLPENAYRTINWISSIPHL